MATPTGHDGNCECDDCLHWEECGEEGEPDCDECRPWLSDYAYDAADDVGVSDADPGL